LRLEELLRENQRLLKAKMPLTEELGC
jgi:hypothetical protein